MAKGSSTLSDQLDRFVEATPPDRDRFVDLLRVVSIAVVIVWHWALSITRWEDGALSMPNPIDVIPGGWLLTWALQIMPMFFLVGGFANYAGWRSVQDDGGAAREFYGARAHRLLLPPVVFLVAWFVLEVLLWLVRTDHRNVLEWGTIVFIPFWFLAAYLWVVLLVPLTARLHAAGGVLTVTVMGALVALVDVGRFHLGLEQLGLVNSALVWVFVHQLGYFYRDGTLERIGWRGQLSLVLAAVAGMIVLTSLPVYPRSMVATRELAFSHMWPTTAVIAVVALLQAGLAMLLRPVASSWLARRRVWKVVIAVNAVILTVFVWHMTAKVAFIGLYEALGFELIAQPTAAWWAQRPLWVLGPGVVLGLLVATFARFELTTRGR
ncbi:acyltransferase family protein [Nitriliruptor alkaliphilus]|uniref:acyltransferase family protein n=1 Tax=Nitriliruptor alkaliphilus TaxID=427918 RepID=UPI000697C46A|nr:acyltransferase [Nitriliruptor alkaliphilus]